LFLLCSAILSDGIAARNAFWEGRDAQYAQLQNWVRSPVVAEKLDLAALHAKDFEIASEFAMARSML
jgi:hypothetical protein